MEQNEKIKIVYVVGPTASGKTRLSVELANILNAEIISADSMQIYKNMDIATAKPTKEEMQGIVHHLIDFVDPAEKFSVAEYVKLARAKIEDIHKRGKQIIVCGGTGFYIDSLMKNVEFYSENSDLDLREKLKQEAIEKGPKYLIDKLAEFDEESAKRIHPNNIKRVIRAIEVYYTTGITMTEHIKNSEVTKSIYNNCIIGLNFKNRGILYDRINTRVDVMIQNGLVNEARNVFKSDYDITAISAIGYKELKAYLDGNESLEDAVNRVKMESRRYAKRQLTWFKRNKDIHWIYVDEERDMDIIVSLASKFIKEDFKI